jgi:hypothetical protein
VARRKRVDDNFCTQEDNRCTSSIVMKTIAAQMKTIIEQRLRWKRQTVTSRRQLLPPGKVAADNFCTGFWQLRQSLHNGSWYTQFTDRYISDD